jgi:large subunit ribosomal protein L31
MAKELKPLEWFRNVGVYYNDELIMQISSTKPRLNVDVWSGNHPFYNRPQGAAKASTSLTKQPLNGRKKS